MTEQGYNYLDSTIHATSLIQHVSKNLEALASTVKKPSKNKEKKKKSKKMESRNHQGF